MPTNGHVSVLKHLTTKLVRFTNLLAQLMLSSFAFSVFQSRTLYSFINIFNPTCYIALTLKILTDIVGRFVYIVNG